MDRYDSIVVGAGHNGLVCAAYLARSGQKVLVLERSDRPGGLAASHEFHPGFKASVAHSISHFPDRIVKDLDLPAHGFEASEPLPLIGLGTDGRHVTVGVDGVRGVSDDDRESYQALTHQLRRFAAALAPFWLKTMPRLGVMAKPDLMGLAHIGFNLRRLGRKQMGEFLRVFALPIRDLMDENFTDEQLKATLSWDAIVGSRMAPRSPNNALLALLYRMAEASSGAHSVPVNGVAGLIKALHGSATAAGAEIRTGTRVERFLVSAGKHGLAVTGVETADGTFEAERVISSADPKTTFLGLLGVRHLQIGFANRIRRLRCGGLVAKLHLALDGLPRFTGLDETRGRMIIAPHLDAIEFAFDDAKYGKCSSRPVMEITIPSLYDPSAASAGRHVLSAHVMYVPHKHRGGWNDAVRTAFADHAIGVIERYAPSIREQIIHGELLTPEDLERKFHVTGGHWHHTELAMDQMLMMRPTYDAARYRTPIPGLYLAGAGCHPAGDLTGAPGHNAAREILG